jgi:NADH dehydrogenase/NADH:ubiquinone oxidoreductase subunit G
VSRKVKAKRCKRLTLKQNKVTIDGQTIEVESGTTISTARMMGGESPPAMCYYSK